MYGFKDKPGCNCCWTCLNCQGGFEPAGALVTTGLGVLDIALSPGLSPCTWTNSYDQESRTLKSDRSDVLWTTREHRVDTTTRGYDTRIRFVRKQVWYTFDYHLEVAVSIHPTNNKKLVVTLREIVNESMQLFVHSITTREILKGCSERFLDPYIWNYPHTYGCNSTHYEPSYDDGLCSSGTPGQPANSDISYSLPAYATDAATDLADYEPSFLDMCYLYTVGYHRTSNLTGQSAEHTNCADYFSPLATSGSNESEIGSPGQVPNAIPVALETYNDSGSCPHTRYSCGDYTPVLDAEGFAYQGISVELYAAS